MSPASEDTSPILKKSFPSVGGAMSNCAPGLAELSPPMKEKPPFPQ